jgi:phosphoserine phosphatase RsbU/P
MGLIQRLTSWWQARLSRQIVIPAVLVTLLFLAVLGFVAFRIGQRAVVAQVESHNRQIAIQVGQEISTFFQTQLDILRLQEAQLLAAPDQQAAALTGLRERFPYTYNDLRLLNARGEETLVLTGTLSQALQNGAVRFDPPRARALDDGVRQALREHTIAISSVAFRPISGSPYVTMTLPLGRCAAPCEARGVLLAQIDLRSFWTKVDSIQIEAGSVSIVDQHGVVLAHPNRQRVGHVLDQATIGPVFQGYEGTTSYRQDGQVYLAAYSPIGNLLGWGVIVEQERGTALAPVRTIGLVATLVTLVSALSLAMLLSAITRRAVQPVETLSRAAAVIATRADLIADVALPEVSRATASDEIGTLARSFNHMVAELHAAQGRLLSWNEELEQRVAERTAQLHTLLEVARLSGGSLHEHEVLATILEQLERLAAYDTATIMLLDDTGTALETAATAGAPGAPRRRVYAPDQYPLKRLVLETRVPLIVPDTRRHPLWHPRQGEEYEAGSWLGVPLVVKERSIGVLGLYKRRADFYGADDAALVTALASQVAVTLAHARLYEESVRRVERELRLAEQIQGSLFPAVAPHAAGLVVASFYRPARETTGDFYAFVTPAGSGALGSNGASPDGAGRFDIIIGDVSGKSLPAALLMAMARTALRSAAAQPSDPAGVMGAANMVLVGEMPHGSFVAGSYARFEPATRTCALVNAAQPAPMLARDGRVVMLEGAGSHLPLGIVAAPEYATATVTLEPGDLLVFYTDGVIEAHSHDRALFGFEQLEEIVSACSAPSIAPAQVVERIMTAVERWIGDVPQHDDIALVVVRVTAEWGGTF